MNRPIVSFLRLPRELRDQVYHEVWRSKIFFHILYKGVVFYVKYGIPEIETPSWLDVELAPSESTTGPPWFLVNKQVLEEAIDQFHRNSFWSYIRHDFGGFDSSLRSSSSLLNPWKANGLRLGEIKFIEDCALSTEGAPSLTYMYHPDETSNQRLSSDSVTALNLRRLEMSLKINFVEYPIDEKPVIFVDFGPLEQLDAPGLQEVYIELIWATGYNTDNSVAIDQLRERVLEFGKTLLKNKGTKNISTTEDDIEDDSESENQLLVTQAPYRALEAVEQPKWLYHFTNLSSLQDEFTYKAQFWA